jgi:hypothetical protein
MGDGEVRVLRKRPAHAVREGYIYIYIYIYTHAWRDVGRGTWDPFGTATSGVAITTHTQTHKHTHTSRTTRTRVLYGTACGTLRAKEEGEEEEKLLKAYVQYGGRRAFVVVYRR